jgi:hypothetical protein
MFAEKSQSEYETLKKKLLQMITSRGPGSDQEIRHTFYSVIKFRLKETTKMQKGRKQMG